MSELGFFVQRMRRRRWERAARLSVVPMLLPALGRAPSAHASVADGVGPLSAAGSGRPWPPARAAPCRSHAGESLVIAPEQVETTRSRYATAVPSSSTIWPGCRPEPPPSCSTAAALPAGASWTRSAVPWRPAAAMRLVRRRWRTESRPASSGPGQSFSGLGFSGLGVALSRFSALSCACCVPARWLRRWPGRPAIRGLPPRRALPGRRRRPGPGWAASPGRRGLSPGGRAVSPG